MKTFNVFLSALAVGLCALSISVQAEVITNNPALPSTVGFYSSGAGVHVLYPPTPVTLTGIRLGHFSNITRMAVGPNEIETFDSILTGIAGPGNVPVTFHGPMSVEVFGKVGNVTGTWSTQMLSMDLTGSVPGLLLRADPVNASTGQTSVTDIGGGLFRIDSFFDVFTDISLDNGITFTPSAGPVRLTLGVPEPATYLTLASLLGLGWMLARRKRLLTKIS